MNDLIIRSANNVGEFIVGSDSNIADKIKNVACNYKLASYKDGVIILFSTFNGIVHMPLTILMDVHAVEYAQKQLTSLYKEYRMFNGIFLKFVMVLEFGTSKIDSINLIDVINRKLVGSVEVIGHTEYTLNYQINDDYNFSSDDITEMSEYIFSRLTCM